MTKITPDLLKGAVVEEVEAEGECIGCIKLRLADGRQVDVTIYGEDGNDVWMEVM